MELVVKVIRKNKKGQSLIEALVTIISLLLIFKIVALTFLLLSNSLWIKYQLYKFLICKEQGRSVIYCERNLLQRFKQFLPIGELSGISVGAQGKKKEAHIKWEIYQINMRIKESITLP